MRHLYSPTPGEFLVGAELEQRHFDVYLPTRDTGIDLLAARDGLHVGIQVKESRTYWEGDRAERWNSWTQLRAEQLRGSSAELWVFVVHAPDLGKTRLRFCRLFVVIGPRELDRRLAAYRPTDDRSVYWHLGEDGRLWEVRGVRRTRPAWEGFRVPERDFTDHLDAWQLVGEPLRSPTH
jgi:hypothetical protein